MDKQPSTRTHITVPSQLLKQIDTVVGTGKRSQFMVEATEQLLKKLKITSVLYRTAGAWSKNHHPELREGSVPYVVRLRKESDKRLKQQQKKTQKA